MISQHSIKIIIAILLIMYACLVILQMKWSESASLLQLKKVKKEDKVNTLNTEQHRSMNESEGRTSLPSERKVQVEQSNCNGQVNLLRGHLKQSQGFLTIGLCTVPRSNASYLEDTLLSLIHQMTEEQKKEVVIVVYLGSHNESDVNKTLSMIEKNFNDSIATGGLQIVQPDISIYPNFSKMSKRTFNDPLQRVRWRTKQNIDFAYLFGYSERFSKYYMHVEDDLDAIPGYITEIKSVVMKQEQSKHHWFVLNFGDGFYGQFFRSGDLCMMKKFMLLFQDQKPCDMLLEDLKQIQLYDFKHVKKFKLKFKHRGEYSSLEGKIVPLKKDTKKKSLPVTTEKMYISRLTSNPPAYIETTFNTYSNFTPDYAYLTNNTIYFWATLPMVGDYYRVKLQSKVLCSRIAIRTGAPLTTKDMLENASILISSNSSSDGECMASQAIGKLSHGKFEHKFETPQELKCLEIIMTENQNHWVIISQIEIET